ncbi:N-acetylmuramoyl-L-alanine amidase [Cohnella zeiphila]|uniref:N-acetylmuramoyl-L-alanine amidase n=1 Tax=Cohnella zeiphila TaxID=2761120 RepID=A0A7X0SKW5_9BACL|nr:N-acetylmuramoyl-L-alanine amidase [Cohnella zeiphila]MBB6731878.1 N-acetylmuramoyl-L-alanine amidase [Cohnella zeiphila]
MDSILKAEHPAITPTELRSVPIIDLRGKTPTNAKYTWSSLKGFRDMSTVTDIIMHHSGMSKLSSVAYDDITWINRIATAHINSTKNIPGGDPGFPYALFVRNGKLYVVNDVNYLTYGVSDHNVQSVHICVDGDYANYDKLADQDRKALYAAYFVVKAALPAFKNLFSHKELAPTSCPGYDMAQVRSYIDNVEEQMDYNASQSADRVTAYAFAERVDDLGKRLTDPKWGPEARRKVMLLAPAIKETAGDARTAESIVARVTDLYKKALSGNFADEATRKLLICADAGKEFGLI